MVDIDSVFEWPLVRCDCALHAWQEQRIADRRINADAGSADQLTAVGDDQLAVRSRLVCLLAVFLIDLPILPASVLRMLSLCVFFFAALLVLPVVFVYCDFVHFCAFDSGYGCILLNQKLLFFIVFWTISIWDSYMYVECG